MASATIGLLWNAIFQHGLLAADLLQRQLAALLVKVLKAVEAVSLIAQYLACLADIAELFCKLEQANFGSNDFLLLSHSGVLLKTPGRALHNPDRSAPAPACDSPWGPGHRLSD
jgi:hypothetical protein